MSSSVGTAPPSGWPDGLSFFPGLAWEIYRRDHKLPPGQVPYPPTPKQGYKAWYSPGGACVLCNQNVNAGEILLGATFPTGDYGPPLHNRCHCELIYTDHTGTTYRINYDQNSSELGKHSDQEPEP